VYSSGGADRELEMERFGYQFYHFEKRRMAANFMKSYKHQMAAP